MDKVCYVGIGGKSFTVDANAYDRLDAYLNVFRSKLSVEERAESMEELESRVAELLHQFMSESGKEVVSLWMVNDVISRIGLPDGSSMDDTYQQNGSRRENGGTQTGQTKKLYRDPRNQMIGGVCAGLAAYADVDVVIIRLLAVLAVFVTVGLLAYVIFWIVVPVADTADKQCELRGLAPTSENLSRFRGR